MTESLADNYRLVESPPPPGAFAELRRVVGWDALSLEAVEKGLGNALFSLMLEDAAGEVVGCARIVGDGAIYFYLQDVIVHPEHQGRGLGHRLMERLMGWLEANAPENAFVGLMAAVGVEEFYVRYGFVRRPAGRPGMFRLWGR